MDKKLILVTGATGYIASRLIPRLLDSGYPVRALARDPLRLKGRSWSRYVEVISGDVMDPATLPAALSGVHTAYYLIHNMSLGRGYIVRELDGARNFASAAEQAAVRHIIYLGGLADPEQHIAPHMRSRLETGKILRQGKVPVTEFRAGVIALLQHLQLRSHAAVFHDRRQRLRPLDVRFQHGRHDLRAA